MPLARGGLSRIREGVDFHPAGYRAIHVPKLVGRFGHRTAAAGSILAQVRLGDGSACLRERLLPCLAPVFELPLDNRDGGAPFEESNDSRVARRPLERQQR
jgi:hypothetical protein